MRWEFGSSKGGLLDGLTGTLKGSGILMGISRVSFFFTIEKVSLTIKGQHCLMIHLSFACKHIVICLGLQHKNVILDGLVTSFSDCCVEISVKR